MTDRPFCSVIIPAFNEQQDIEKCLLSLTHQTYPRDRFEIIVVDNGSTDKTAEIASAFADLVFDKPEGNVGAVRNYGISHASGEIIICTDADCIAPPNWIEKGVALLQSNPQHAFGGGLTPRKGAKWVEKYWLLNPNGNKAQQRALAGSSIFIWKRNFEKIGGFNEIVTAGEDTDLHERALAFGIKSSVCPQLSVVHLGCPETPKEFIKRQIWHSENYICDLKNSLKDIVFWLTIIYFACAVTTYFFLFTADYSAMAFMLVCTQTPAIILSLKRIIRSSWSINSIDEILKILLLDNFYLIGRSIGLVKGSAEAVSNLGKQFSKWH